MPIESVNPATGERLRSFETESAPAVEAKLARAARAFKTWSRRPPGERAEIVAAIALGGSSVLARRRNPAGSEIASAIQEAVSWRA